MLRPPGTTFLEQDETARHTCEVCHPHASFSSDEKTTGLQNFINALRDAHRYGNNHRTASQA